LLAFVLAASLTPAAAPATVQEQRARLPPAAQCSDAVSGIWKSHKYDDRYREWMMRTLDIQRVEGSETELQGTIESHYWAGEPEQSQPGPCQGQQHVIVSMDARGNTEGDQIVFSGFGQWRLDELVCGSLEGYNLDSFAGTVDRELQEFQSVNNDGGRAIDQPEVFRRVSCHPPAPGQEHAPRISVAPPPFYPPEQARGGCGCD
jgi:hypothetical protein